MAVDRSTLPLPGPPLSCNFPEMRRATLDNGLRICTIEHHEVPLITCFVLMPIGSSQDPEHQPGLAAITGDLLDEGSGDLDALAVHEALGRIGAHLDTEIGADATLLELTTLEQYAPRALELLASMVRSPRLDQRDFDRVRELRLNRLVQLRDLPPAVADRVFTQFLYADHPYGHLPIGTEAALRSLVLNDVTAFHRRLYTPAQATVIAVGDAPHERLVALVAGAFGDWQTPAGAGLPVLDIATLEVPPLDAGRLVTVHRPGAAQSELRIGHIGLPRSTPDYHALLVMNMILGGQFVSRLNMKLRQEKGLTYGARTTFDFRRGRGPFMLQTSVQSDGTAEAVKASLAEIDDIRTARPPTAEEVEVARAGLTRGYARSFETAEHLARAMAQLVLYDLPDDYFDTFTSQIESVTVEAARNAAVVHLHPDRLATAIVSDSSIVIPQLAAAGLGEPTPLLPRL